VNVLAQAAVDAGTQSILQVGAVGGVAVLALGAVVVMYRQITANAKADRDARERAEERERQSHADLVDKVMPALANVQDVLKAAVEAMRDERRERR
jgi:hypothetical protein